MQPGPHWGPEMTNLEVGHRGTGQSYMDDPSGNSDYLENTVLSLNVVHVTFLYLVREH